LSPVRLTADRPRGCLRLDGELLGLPSLRLQGPRVRIGPLSIALRLLQLQLGQHGLADGCAGRG
jgi:hypothetical protein